MELSRKESIVTPVKYSLEKKAELSSNKKFKVKIGEDELDERVPEGKVWDIGILVMITETDA